MLTPKKRMKNYLNYPNISLLDISNWLINGCFNNRSPFAAWMALATAPPAGGNPGSPNPVGDRLL